MNLIVTAAGLSARFEGLKPKWMLTHPSGNWMLVEALKGLDFTNIKNVYFGFLEEHLIEYNCIDALNLCFEEIGIKDKATLVVLKNRTINQPHTVYEIVKQARISGQIIIKEVDNQFSYNFEPGNFMCYYDLNNTTLINPSNKSYIKIDSNNYITSIVEKHVISATFGCGSYSFNSADVYCTYFNKNRDIKNLFLSDIIKNMIEDGLPFKAIKVSKYVDWGTKEDWFAYTSKYKTLFVDIDGVLVEGGGGKYLKPYWGDNEGITKNIKFLNKLHSTGKVHIILTTARPKSMQEETIKQLKREGILYNNIIFDLYHGNRIIINDYGSSNLYPTCEAVNISRDNNELERFITS